MGEETGAPSTIDGLDTTTGWPIGEAPKGIVAGAGRIAGKLLMGFEIGFSVEGAPGFRGFGFKFTVLGGWLGVTAAPEPKAGEFVCRSGMSDGCCWIGAIAKRLLLGLLLPDGPSLSLGVGAIVLGDTF